MVSVLESAGDIIGFAKWNLGIGLIGNLLLLLLFCCIITIIIGVFVYMFISKRIYKHQIVVIGMIGNSVMEKWKDTAKEVLIGRAGDKLYLLRRRKRFLPPPTIQSGMHKWIFWEREDGELINVGYENLDEKMKLMGLKFVDTDMRMQRLGIEKNLQYRLQKEGFWDKYGDKIVNMAFYVLLTVLIIVIFSQMGKIAGNLNEAVKTTCTTTPPEVSPHVPEEEQGSGLIPQLVSLNLLNIHGGENG